ncbi:FMN-binding split barrel [Akanthomyces lecanii RCEF 1005]|uniref:FMN-binding split barrel n=1 Tax=Akanthomyces lecanii RCEF 1005 TaxID=1081108 RepID=A0A162K6E9_CORDF|nr:FMN-binding split barrel [Akanthomyces lecanii RCEF 1005]
MSHIAISPAILYWGTPVALIASENEDGSSNISVISSAYWLVDHCILGFAAGSQTPQNILRSGHCTVNLPEDALVASVNALATTTGTPEPSASKIARGYRHVKDKWTVAGLTPQASDLVHAPRIRECPVQMECELVDRHGLTQDAPTMAGALIILELKVLRVHVLERLRMPGHVNRIDPDRWRPMIMSFQQIYGLRDTKIAPSQLAEIDEELYRPPAQTRSTAP